MKVQSISFGERYGDDSGWARHLEIDIQQDSVYVNADGSQISMTTDDAWWMLAALMEAREKLGMDPIRLSRPEPPRAELPPRAEP